MPVGTPNGPMPKDYPWATRFIEIALRAIRRVHYEYGVWSVGHQWMRDVSDPPDLNMGPGIELADEPTVCAAITQEFANSQFVAGIWQERKSESDVSEGERFWQIDREQCYEGSQERVDICIQRYERKRLGEVPEPTSGPPVFIEAKRARRWSAQISTGSLKRSEYLTSEIKNDIEKLRREMESRRVYCHLLVWNIYESPSDGPLEFFERLQASCVTVHQVRWLPIAWTCPTYVESVVDWKPYLPEVNKWLWIALAEVLREPKDVSQEL
jgi:hypothetical protein